MRRATAFLCVGIACAVGVCVTLVEIAVHYEIPRLHRALLATSAGTLVCVALVVCMHVANDADDLTITRTNAATRGAVSSSGQHAVVFHRPPLQWSANGESPIEPTDR